MQLGDVVDQLHDDNRFAHAGAAKRPDLAALEEGADEINYLDAGGEDLRGGGLVGQARGRPVNRHVFFRHHRPPLVHRVAGDVKDAPHDAVAHRHGDGLAGIEYFHAAFKPVRGGHGDGAHPVIAQVLLDFEGQPGFALERKLVFDGQGVVDGGELSRELDIHHRADDLNDFAFIHAFGMMRKE